MDEKQSDKLENIGKWIASILWFFAVNYWLLWIWRYFALRFEFPVITYCEMMLIRIFVVLMFKKYRFAEQSK